MQKHFSVHDIVPRAHYPTYKLSTYFTTCGFNDFISLGEIILIISPIVISKIINIDSLFMKFSANLLTSFYVLVFCIAIALFRNRIQAFLIMMTRSLHDFANEWNSSYIDDEHDDDKRN